MSKSTCTICSKTIHKFEEIEVLDQTWHRSCFKCGAGSNNGCGQSLSIDSYREHDNIPYCSKCHISMKRNSVDREKVTSNTNTTNNTEERTRSQPLVKKPPPTTSPTHISKDIVDNIIKKKAAPLSPPPPMSPGGFKPKDISKLIAKSPHHRDAKHDSSSDSNSDSNSQSSKDSKSSDSNSDDEHIPPRKSLFPPKGHRHTDNRRQGNDSDSDSDDSNDSSHDKAPPKKHTSKKNKSDTNNNTATTAKAESKVSERDSTLTNDNNETKQTTTNTNPNKPSKSIPKINTNTTTNNSKNKEIIFNFTKFLHSAKNRKLKAFLLSPVNRGITVRCYIERDRFGANMLGKYCIVCCVCVCGV